MTTQIASAALLTTATLTCQAKGGKTQATADLSAQFTMIPLTAFLQINQGILDTVSGTIKAQGVSRWNNYTSWSNFGDYRGVLSEIIWTAPLIDVGELKYFTISTDAEFDGTMSYEIYTSTTGVFQGEETRTTVVEGDFDIAAFYGQYVYVIARVSGNELRNLNITTSSQTSTRTLRDVDTSTLAGTISSRAIPLSRPVSRVMNIVISPKTTTAYAVDLYVSNTATSEVLIPMVVSKADSEPYFVTDYIVTDYFVEGSTPSFVLYGLDNQARNGIVDINLEVLPRQIMTAGNIVTIA
jgi:hypothetical protein